MGKIYERMYGLSFVGDPDETGYATRYLTEPRVVRLKRII